MRILCTSDIHVLRKLQRNPADSSGYARVTCIFVSNSPSFVAECSRMDTSMVYRCRNAYLHGGTDELSENRHKDYWGVLDYRRLSQYIHTNAKSVSDWIYWSFGVRYTVRGTVGWLKRIGFTCKKTTGVPYETDTSGQEEFMRKLQSLLKGKAGTDIVYYADGVHPAHNSHSAYAWMEKGEESARPAVIGRDRMKINGLLNVYDVTDVTAYDCDSDSVNAQSIKNLYEAALEKHPEASRIYIISDNARYYRNRELLERVKGTKIIPLFLPPYSPDLNLMERLWKFLRKKVTNTGFHWTKGAFRKAIRDFFDRTGCYKEELKILLTLNFRLINSQTISV